MNRFHVEFLAIVTEIDEYTSERKVSTPRMVSFLVSAHDDEDAALKVSEAIGKLVYVPEDES